MHGWCAEGYRLGYKVVQRVHGGTQTVHRGCTEGSRLDYKGAWMVYRECMKGYDGAQRVCGGCAENVERAQKVHRGI